MLDESVGWQLCVSIVAGAVVGTLVTFGLTLAHLGGGILVGMGIAVVFATVRRLLAGHWR